MLRLGLCGGVWVDSGGRRLPDTLLAGRQGRLVFAYLVCNRDRSVSKEELADLIWSDILPNSWASSLSAVASKLRRLFTEAGLDGTATLASAFGSYRLHLPVDAWVDWEHVVAMVERAEQSVAEGHSSEAISAAREAQDIARRGFLTDDCTWVDTQRERLRDLNIRAAHAQAQAHGQAGQPSRAVIAARDAVALDDLREASYRLLMQALADAGERGEALRVWERCRTMLVDELGVDPAPETEALYLAILGQSAATAPPPPAPSATKLPSGVVTFLLTDIVDSSALWERNPAAMNIALERHDQIVASVVEQHGGTLLKAKLEGDATVSVFPRASAGLEAAIALRQRLIDEEWPDGAAPAVRMALHTGESVERDGDYFGPALNRAARLRALAAGGQILLSQAVAEVVRDHLPDSAALRSLGEQQLRGMSRAEHVFELVAAGDDVPSEPPASALSPAPRFDRPRIPSVLAGRGTFVGRGSELEKIATEWTNATAGTARAVLIAGEPGVGKTRLAAEWARKVYEEGGIVLYGRCDEEFGAPYQPFAEALRSLAPSLGATRLKTIRGVEELVRLVPELADLAGGLGEPAQADPDTERALLFDAVVRLYATVSAEAPLLVVVDDLHWAAKPTLLMLRHLLRSDETSRLLIVGTYRSTDLDRTHPLAGILADLHRDATVERVGLGGLGDEDVQAYVSAAGYEDDRLARTLTTVTSGNPFFLIEVLRHLDESGGRWDPNTLPQGVREAVSRRLNRLSDLANETLLVGAIVGSQFSLELVEQVLERDLVEPIEEARNAGLVVEEPGSRFRFNHALVRQSLLGEVASVRRVRLHQRVATALEADPAVGDVHLADLARHWFECAFAGGAAKAVDYSRRAAEQAMARLAYEEAADLYDQAVQSAEIEGSGCMETEQAELLLARCEALLAAGDPTTAVGVVDKVQRAAQSSTALAAWATCYAAQLAILTHPERLDTIAEEVAQAAARFVEIGDFEGEAKAHTVRASCLARLGRVGDGEAALDRALTAGRKAGNPRRVNSVLGYAPLAALWGPSPIARASGRCLDVVRVLRITTGSPAVEAVALRCQAVLEAMRGRTDAARRMLGSARRSLESLGHTHGLLEVDVFAGIIELISGQPAEAELALRRAYDGFVSRGVGVDAAQAAAHLARALLAQGRIDEAIALTEESERLAGVDLQAAIAWRAARAEALARQGAISEGLDVARAAVALADPTDILIDQADAHYSLSLVLRASGNDTEAEKESRRAIALYEQKGATARVEALRAQPAQPSQSPSVQAATSAAPSGDGRRRRVRPNAACLGFEAGPADEEHLSQWTAMLAEDAVTFDHRFQTAHDREAVIATWRMLTDGQDPIVLRETLATLGERHALTRCRWQTAGGRHFVEWLRVARVDSQGRLVRFEQFNADDLNEALARLTEMYAEDELPPERQAFWREVDLQIRRGAPVWSEDAVVSDHRQVGLGTLHGREAIRSAAKALGDAAGEISFKIDDVLGFSDRTALAEWVARGVTDAGGPFELPILWLFQYDDDGRIRQADWYSPEQADEALARFDEITAAPPSLRRIRPNLVSRAVERGPLDETHIAQWGERLADNVVSVDHRLQVTLDRDGVIDSWRAMATGDGPTMEVTLWATLGERHGLGRCEWQTSRGRHTVEFLAVARADQNGRVVRLEQFESSDLPAALARLIEMHADDELAPERHDARYQMAKSFRERRMYWSGDDAVVVDHRPASLGTLEGLPAIRNAASAMRELSKDLRWNLADIIGATETTLMAEVISEGEAADHGGRFEMRMFTVNVFSDGGLLSRTEWYSLDQRDEALARFDELTAAQAPVVRLIRPNLATALQLWGAGTFRDHTVAEWEDRVAPDFVSVDHRFQTTEGRDGQLAMIRMWDGMDNFTFDVTLLASLGERHSLARRGYRMQGVPVGRGSAAIVSDGEVEFLQVLRVDAEGRMLRTERFALDLLHEAVARLIELHADDELPLPQHNARHQVARAFQERHVYWDNDAVVVDRRPASLGVLEGLDAIRNAGSALRQLTEDLRWNVVDLIGLTERVVLEEVISEGQAAEYGGHFEMRMFSIVVLSDPGLVQRVEWYSLDQRDEALARFDELTSATAHPERRVRPNTASERLPQGVLDHEMVDRWAAALAEDFTSFDHRNQLTMSRDTTVATWRLMVSDHGAAEIIAPTIATLGERHALHSCTWRVRGRTVSEAEVAWLNVMRTNTEGQVVHWEQFGPDDVNLALARLVELHAEDELPPDRFDERARVAKSFRETHSLWSDDAVLVDHRPASLGTLSGREAIAKAAKALRDLGPNAQRRMVDVPALTERVSVFEIRTEGAVDGGGSFELTVFAVSEVDSNGLCRRQEWFGPDQRAEALARFDELIRDNASDHECEHRNNAATRTLRRFEERFAARDWIGVSEIATADNVTEDRRSLVGGHRTEGHDEYVQFWNASAEVGALEVRFRTIATRGNRLCLSLTVAVFEHAEIPYHSVIEVDAEGRIVSGINFDVDDFDAAYEELDTRYSAGEGAGSEAWAIWKEMEAAHLERNWALFRAIHTSDFVFVDRRHAGSGTLDLDEYVGARRAMVELAPDTRLRLVAIPVSEENGAIYLIRLSGTNETGGDYELEMLALGVFAESKVSQIEFFELDALADAQRRLEELTAEPHPVPAYLETEATRLDARMWGWILTGNWDAVWAMTSEDVVVDGRRAVIGSRHQGRDEALRVLKSMTDVGVTEHNASVLATRGEHLYIAKVLFSGSHAESEVLALPEYRTGQWRGVILFDPDQLDMAYRELDARYSEEAPVSWWIGSRFIDALNRRDWPALSSLVTAEYTYVDRREIGFGQLDLEGHVEWAQSLVDIAPDTRWRVVGVPRVTGQGSVTAITVIGTTSDGGDFEIPVLSVNVNRESRIRRLEIWPADNLARALERFEELCSAATEVIPRHLDNAAARLHARQWERQLAGDFDFLRATTAEDVVMDDRRALVGLRSEGRDAAISWLESLVSIGVTGWEAVVLATRGEQLVLERELVGGQHGEGEVLAVHEYRKGLWEGTTSFDPADSDASYAELDARYLGGLSVPRSDVWSHVADSVRTFNHRDWDGLAASIAPGFTFVDHRPVGWGALDRDEFIAHVRGLPEISPDACCRIVAVERLNPTGAVCVLRNSGTGEGGGEFVFEHVNVGVLDRTGRWQRIEWYPLDQMETALAHLDELCPPAPAVEVSNDAFRGWRAQIAHFEARNWDALAAGVAAHVVAEDRRRILGGLTHTGPAEYMKMWRSIAAIGVTAVIDTPLATRGDRLVLHRSLLRGATGESEMLLVTEFDHDGLHLGGVSFDPEDVDPAYTELDARYTAGEGVAFSGEWSAIVAAEHAYNRRDWKAFAALGTDDFVFLDRRPVGWGELNHDFVTHLQALLDLAPDHTGRIAVVLRITNGAALLVESTGGTDAEGGAFTMDHLSVAAFNGGLFRRLEWFRVEDLDEAIAHYEELAAQAAPPAQSLSTDFQQPHSETPAPSLDNSASRALDAMSAFGLEGNWQAYAERTANRAVVDDRRRLVTYRGEGRDAVVRFSRSAIEVGVRQIIRTRIATRGDRLVLTRDIARGRDAETELLRVSEVDSEGLWLGQVLFDSEDLDAAYAELDARYAAGEGSAFAGALKAATSLLARYNERDWDYFRSVCASDFEAFDHRPVGWGRLDQDGLVVTLRAFEELVPEWKASISSVIHLGQHGGVVRVHSHGVDRNGGQIEMKFVMVGVLRGYLWTHLGFFSLDAVDDALARFDELTASAPARSPLENLALCAINRGADLAVDGDWQGYANGIADNAVLDDRRRLFQLRAVGRDEVVTFARSAFEVGVREVLRTAIATRGERLVFTRDVYRGPDAETEILRVSEIDSDGLWLGGVMLDPEDLDAAYDELDARYAAGETEKASNVWRRTAGATHAFTNRDWTDFAAGFGDSYVFVDHRSLGIGRLAEAGQQGDYDRSTLVHLFQELVSVTPDARIRITEVLRITDGGVLCRYVLTGQTDGGVETEASAVMVSVHHAGLIVRHEAFDEADEDAALARFEELTAEGSADSSSPLLENQATRLLGTWVDYLLADDWAALSEIVAPNAVGDDRRPVIGHHLEGLDLVLQEQKSVRRVGVTEIQVTPIAVRGERLALTRQRYAGASGETVVLSVFELSPDRQALGYCVFEEDDIDAAFDELDLRYAAGEASPNATIWSTLAAWCAGVNGRDWEACRAVLTDDCVMVDHRPIGLPYLDSDGLVRMMGESVDLSPDCRLRVVAVMRFVDRGIAWYQRFIGTGKMGGGDWEKEGLFVAQIGGGLRRIEVFPTSEREAALACLERFGEAQSVVHRDLIGNEAARRRARDWRWALQGDWEALRAVCHPQVVVDDRRAVVGTRAEGRDEALAFFRSIIDIGATSADVTPIASRGERLVLNRELVHIGESAAEGLVVTEYDEDGMYLASVVFNPDDEDAAFNELDERFAAGEGAVCLDGWRILRQFQDAMNGSGWRATPAAVEDFSFVDHRLVGAGRTGLTGFGRYVQSWSDLVPQSRCVWVAIPRLSPATIMGQIRGVGTTGPGAEVVVEVVCIVSVQGGRPSQVEIFDLEQATEALARFDELAGADADADPVSTAEQASRRFDAALLAHDWHLLGSVLDPDVVRIDRRSGLQLEYQGWDQVVAENRLISEGVEDLAVTTVATRGAHLVLQHKRASGSPGSAGPAEFEILMLLETGEDETITRIVWFDPGDQAAAVEELDTRYLASLPAADAEIWNASRLFGAAYNARDEAALLSALTEDCVIVDERMTGWGVLDAKAFIRHLGQMIELAPDVFLSCVIIHHLSPNGSVARFRVNGTVPGGGEFELVFEGATVVQNGRISRLELLPEGQVLDAVERLEHSAEA